MRIKFKRGEQRKFLDLVIEKTSSPSLRGLLQFGLETNYSTLKNYYNESRLLPGFIFDELLELARLSREEVDFELVDDNWGKVRGGQIGKRKS
jgi:hypothetical protein